MPEYLAPGVFVEETGFRQRSIDGVSTSIAGFAGQTERGPAAPRRVASWGEFVAWYGDFHSALDSFLPFALKGFFDNGGGSAFVARVHAADAIAAGLELATSSATQRLRVDAIGAGDWGNRLFVRVTPVSGAQPDRFRLTIAYYRVAPPTPLVDPTDPALRNDPNRRAPDLMEDFDSLELDPAAAGYALVKVNGGSRLVELSWADAAVPPSRPVDVAFVPMSDIGGTNGTSSIGSAEYLGSPAAGAGRQKGLAALEPIDDVSILCVPDEVHPSLTESDRSDIRNAMVDQCSRRGDRFAVLQVAAGQTDAKAIVPPMDTKWAAIYYPWIRVSNPRTGASELVPPGGHVAGIYARTDAARGVHRAPANEVVRGIVTPGPSSNINPLERTVTEAEHELLNPKGINVIRDFRSAGRGVRVWGARTISSDPEWKYVNVRRLFIFLEESIDKGTQWVVFEPNGDPTWNTVRSSIEDFLMAHWRNGALQGDKAEDAFFVRCDRTTMTQNDIDNGRLVCLIGVATLKPAEFVIFRIGQFTADAS